MTRLPGIAGLAQAARAAADRWGAAAESRATQAAVAATWAPRGAARPRAMPSRRDWLVTALGAAAGFGARPSAAHGDLGLVTPPRAAPGLSLTLHDGRNTHLAALLNGRLTALQLMFTGCSAICPVQGASFAALQDMLGDARAAAGPVPVQLLSLSIDPLADDARALAAWRARFAARPGWIAAAPPLQHADVMLDFIQGRSPRNAAAGDRHNAQVFLFDARGRLAYRCAELAAPADVARALVALARLPAV